MNPKTLGWSLFLLLGVAGYNPAQDPPIQKLRIGEAAPAWKDLDGVDGNKHSLASLKDKDLVVVVFTCNDCKTANACEQRLMRFGEAYSKPDSKVAVVAVSLYNHGERDSLEAMKVRSRDKGYKFSYIIDPTMKLGLDYGALRTPHVFILNKERKIAFMGPMDDAVDPRKVKSSYVQQAIDALAKGQQPAVTQVEVRFCCPIRYKQP